jgi:hypothetical protein
VKEIQTTNGKIAFVDDEDFAFLNAFRWFGCGAYPQARITRYGTGSGTKTISMHTFLLRGQGLIVDHINGNPYDNRKSNLRLVTQAQNIANSHKKHYSEFNPYKGVSCSNLMRYGSKRQGDNRQGAIAKDYWIATIRVDGKSVRLGRYDTPEDAARAYDRAALKHFGQFANINFPDSSEKAA